MSTIPMNLSPHWNGQIDNYRNQYELLAESFINGHTYLDYDVDPILNTLDNPYDPLKRKELNVKYHWDHAFYKGKYYSYFGVVPTIILFVPYKIITGKQLTSYHATQFFVFMIIVGLFYLFWELAKYTQTHIPYATLLYFSVSFSLLSVYYSIDTPALYCTAISSGVFFAVFSMIFAIKYIKSNNTKIYCLVLCAISGGLVLGCRPSIALFNIMFIPLIKNIVADKKYIHLVSFIIPYILILFLIMAYNYSRFDNFFEFGLSYQLTLADQSKYMSDIWSRLSVEKIAKEIIAYFFSFSEIGTESIKYLRGVFVNFPVLLLSFFILFKKNFSRFKGNIFYEYFLYLFLSTFFVALLTIVSVDHIIERYHMDVYFSFSIISMFSILVIYDTAKAQLKKLLNICFLVVNFFTVLFCFFYLIKPHDCSFTELNDKIMLSLDDVIWFNFFN